MLHINRLLGTHHKTPLFDVLATRHLEACAAAQLPAYTLMQRAGTAIARLARALAPHARTIWIACGSGNNGGDGLEAALQLHMQGLPVQVTWLGAPHRTPPDALRAWQRAHEAGVVFSPAVPPNLGPQDICIDALLGIGLTPKRTTAVLAGADADSADRHARLHTCLQALHSSTAPVLCVDVPSGLHSDSGQYAPGCAPLAAADGIRAARHTLTLLTLKPGLFTGVGRDAAGSVWFDDLGVDSTWQAHLPCAWLSGTPAPVPRAHASHKGHFGDVAIVGGQALARCGLGMTGAALLAARAALHAGAGRVFVSLLEAEIGSSKDASISVDTAQPELMLRRFEALDLSQLTVVCGCGGGSAIAAHLPEVLTQAPRLVLDADALNAIAIDPTLQIMLQARSSIRGYSTILTPHPLEAARLLCCSTAHVQAQRMQAAQHIAQRYHCTVLLKGSGSVIAAPECIPVINPTGNARLASAGTGDVLAGMLGAYLAVHNCAFEAACRACWSHGHAAGTWPADTDSALTASALARSKWLAFSGT